MSCHPIKSTSLGGKCSVWEDVTGKVMCAHLLLLLLFFTNTTCDKKKNTTDAGGGVYCHPQYSADTRVV